MKKDQIRCRLRMGVFLAVFTGWLLLPVKAEAGALYFPYFADTWPYIASEDPGLLLLKRRAGKEAEEKKAGEKKTAPKHKKTDRPAQSGSEDQALSAEDMEVLYKVVSMECDTGYEGSLAVISCMLNRQASGKYPDDLMDVVREDSQFTAYYDKETGTYPYVDREPSEECIAAVNDALKNGKRNIPGYIYYFRSSDYDHLNGYITYGQIGDNTYFYQYEDQ